MTVVSVKTCGKPEYNECGFEPDGCNVCYVYLLYYLFGRLWGTSPTFSRDSFFDDFCPSFLEADVAAEVEWLVLV